MSKAMLENSVEEEKIKILFAKIIEDKTKDEMLNTFKNVKPLANINTTIWLGTLV